MPGKPCKCGISVRTQGHGGFIVDWRIEHPDLGETTCHLRYKDLPPELRDKVLAIYQGAADRWDEEVTIDSDSQHESFVQDSLETLSKVAETFLAESQK